MGKVKLPSGLEIVLDLEPFVRFAREEWSYYDGISDREPNRIVPEDVLVTVAVNSRVDTADRVRTIHRGMAKACDRLLSEIPTDADIRSYDLNGAKVKELLSAACGVKYVGMAVATKVLHRKRPRWIPMLDSVMNRAYLDAIGKPGLKARLDQGAAAGGVGAFIVGAMRRDIEAVEKPIGAVSVALAGAGYPISDLRILEIAIWQAEEGMAYYR